MGAGYGFVKFADRSCANTALQYLNVSACMGGGRDDGRRERGAGGGCVATLVGRRTRGAGSRGGSGSGRKYLQRQLPRNALDRRLPPSPPPLTPPPAAASPAPKQNKVLFGQEMRVNWAFQSHQREDTSTHWHVFVGDLGQDVTDAVLHAAFSQTPGCS
jgi:RNA recognition motif-containing protein